MSSRVVRVRVALTGLGLTAALVMTSACAPEGAETDLLTLFPFTERGQEVQTIDLGTHAAEAHLVAGWSQPDTLPSGETVAWGVARRSSVRFAIAAPAEGRLIVRCALPGEGHRHAAPIMVSLNHRRVGSLRLGAELQEHALPLPARVQRAGMNELEFSNPLVFPVRVRARRRARAIGCDLIRFEGLNADSEQRAAVVGDGPTRALLLPAATRVDFHLRIPADGALSFGVEGAGEGTSLRVALLPERGEERELFAGSPSTSAIRVPLSPARQLARLSFEARGGPLRLLDPRIRSAESSPDGGRTTAAHAGRRPNVLLYVIDTLRADRLGCYGYSRPTSPRIDALAADGLLFANAVSQSSWTTPATASILTGRNPPGHGALTMGEGMRPDVPTLAEILRQHGYRTGALVTNGNVTGSLGFGRGFDHYAYLPEERSRPTVHVPSDELHQRVVAWLRQGDARPFFLYVHASDPHAPYAPPERLAARFRPPGPLPALAQVGDPVRAMTADPTLHTPANVDYLSALYDAEIAFTDENVGALADELRRLGLWDESLVVLTADHGEELHERGRFGHGYSLYREQTRIPLILRLPDGSERGRRANGLARQIDIAPTVLGYLGIPSPKDADGRSLLPLDDVAGEPEAFTHTALGFPAKSAVMTATWKVIESASHVPRVEVYDLRADPEERNDLAGAAPVVLGYGRQLLAQWTASAPRPRYDRDGAPDVPVMDERTRRRLEALGYVN